MSDTINTNEPPTNTTTEHASAATAVEVPSYLPRQTIAQLLRNDLGFLPVLLTLLIIFAYFSIVSPFFLTSGNLTNLIQQVPTIGVDALGATLVLLLGEIDLSIAAVGTLCAVVMGIFSERLGLPGWEAILLGLLTGAVVGLINGFFIAVLRIPSFIVTLAGSIGYSGLLLHLLNNQTTLIVRDPFIVSIAGSATSFLPSIYGIGLPTLAVVIYAALQLYDHFQRQRAGLRARPLWQLIAQIALVAVLVEGAVSLFENNLGVPNSTAILFALIVIFWILLTKTPFGRHVYAVGGNAEAARRAGISVVGVRVMMFTLCSTLAAVGGILASSRGLSVESQVDPTLLLSAIAAAVIGGVSLFGGRGSVWFIVLGTLIIGSLTNGLALLNLGSDVQSMIEGLVLIIAVTVDALVRRAQARTGR